MHTRTRATGFSLIELMVGMLISLIGTLAMMKTFAAFEAQKRTTTSGDDAQQNGAYSTSGAGVIYQIKSLAGPKVNFATINGGIELTWSHGLLERATSLDAEWTVVASAPGPYVIQSDDTPQFFRTRN